MRSALRRCPQCRESFMLNPMSPTYISPFIIPKRLISNDLGSPIINEIDVGEIEADALNNVETIDLTAYETLNFDDLE